MILGSCCSVELDLITAAHGLLGCMIIIGSYTTLGSIKLIVVLHTLHIYITYIYILHIYGGYFRFVIAWWLSDDCFTMVFMDLWSLLGSAVPTIYRTISPFKSGWPNIHQYPNFWRFKWADWMGCFIFCYIRIFYYPTNSSIFVAGDLRLAMFGYSW